MKLFNCSRVITVRRVITCLHCGCRVVGNSCRDWWACCTCHWVRWHHAWVVAWRLQWGAASVCAVVGWITRSHLSHGCAEEWHVIRWTSSCGATILVTWGVLDRGHMGRLVIWSIGRRVVVHYIRRRIAWMLACPTVSRTWGTVRSWSMVSPTRVSWCITVPRHWRMRWIITALATSASGVSRVNRTDTRIIRVGRSELRWSVHCIRLVIGCATIVIVSGLVRVRRWPSDCRG